MQKKRWFHWLEELILVLLILLNIFDFFEILPADLDYVKKVISWTALGYLLYKVSLTKIFFNNPHRHVDLLLILSYFMLIFKNIIVFSTGIIEEFYVFYDLQQFIVANATILESYSLIVGSAVILLLAIYSAFSIEVKKLSLMQIIHEKGIPKTPYKIISRILIVYLVYMAFFVVVFNLVMEWLAIAIDAPLIMLALLFYLFVIIRHYQKYNAENLIYKIGEFGEKFYGKFISLFHYKKTILLGISGMLVLHLLTDALSFIIPYIFIFKDTLYFSQLGAGHDALIPLFLEQITSQPFLEQLSLFFVYLLNVVGILLLLLLPSFLWYIAFSGKKFSISKIKISLIITSIAIFIIAPVFKINRLTENSIVGVDIKTGFAQNIFFNNFFQVLFFAFIFFIAIALLADLYKKYLVQLVLLKIMLFFTYYIYLFSTSLFLYYIDIITTLIAASNVMLSFHLLIFFAISVLFYIAGFIMYIDELIKEKVYKKIS